MKKTLLFPAAVLIATVIIGVIIWQQFIRLPSTYSAEAIAGQVVDKDTGEPLEGAIVVAVWELERDFTKGVIGAGHMHVAEVLTDQDGFYNIEAWGPKKRPEGRRANFSSPLLIYFKDGYDFTHRDNEHWYEEIRRQYRHRKVHTSDAHMETIKLEKFDGNLEEYYLRLAKIESNLMAITDRIMGAGDCDWVKIPRLILTFDKYYQLLKERGVRSSRITPLEVLLARKSCGINNKEELITE